MLSSFPIALIIGATLGCLAGLGVGGGSLLMLWLTLVLQMEYPAAKVLNLLFFLPSAIIASLFRWKQGNLPIKKVWPAILAGCASASLCGWLGANINTVYLRKIFGILLIFTGIREVFYKRNKKAGQK